jgi:hypothetical protein
LKGVKWLNEPPEDEEETQEMALLNPIKEVESDDELYHGAGETIETFDSRLVILAQIPASEERNLVASS